MVKFVTGRAGKGKTYYIYEDIRGNLAEKGEDKLILLVPEQFTLQTERDLIRYLGVPGIMRLEVLSISRLGQRVLQETGGRSRTLINEQGRNMILKKIIDERSSDFEIYGKACRQQGFVQKMADLISELKQQDIIPQTLQEKASLCRADSIIKQKLHDIVLIYQGFNEYMQDRYIDMQDYTNLFIKKLQDSQWLAGAKVWIDSFSTFSAQSLRVIEQIMCQADQVTISVSIDNHPNARDKDLFELSAYTFSKLQEIAVKCQLKQELIELDGSSIPSNKRPELLFMESELFAYPYDIYNYECAAMEIFAARNIYTEVENVAASIVGLCRDQGYRYREIAVICGDIDIYGPLIKRVFQDYSLPFFMDRKQDIMNHPVVELILAALEIARGRYRYEDIFRYLKTGLAGINQAETEQLENYVLAYGIKGKAWKSDFVKGINEELKQLNHWRKKIIKPLEVLETETHKSRNYAGITRALMNFMELVELPRQIEELIDQLGDLGLLDLQAESRQIWSVIQEIMQQIIELLGEQRVNLREYRVVLETGLQSYELGLIPTTIDQVLVGNIQRSKSHDVRALFVIGVNDGILPSGVTREGILSEDERDWLNEQGVELGLSQALKAVQESFLIYNSFSKPSDYLRLSYALSDIESRALRPSLLVERFKQLYPRIKLTDDIVRIPGQELNLVCTPASTYKHMLGNLRDYLDGREIDPIWWDVYTWYRDNEEWQQRNQMILEGFFHHNQPGKVSAAKANQLFSFPLRSSVSRLEQYINCPFAHFVNYGLKPAERQLYEVALPDIGEIFHRTLQNFSRELAQNNLNWRNLNREQSDEIIDRLMDSILDQHQEGIFTSSSRYKHLRNRLKRISRRAAWTLTNHLQKGDFIFKGHEIRFGSQENCELPPIVVRIEGGQELYLEGRIDRLDLWPGEEGDYVKIIDYKSSLNKLEISDIYYGLNLQLLVYLAAVINGLGKQVGKTIKPAGIFYFTIDDPIVADDGQLTEEIIERKINKELKLSGLALADTRIVKLMDRDIGDNSDILPVRIRVNDEFYKDSAVVEEEVFWNLIEYTLKKVAEIGAEIRQGNIRIEPVRKGTRTACDYCLYHSICQFDLLFLDNNYRNIYKLEKEEVFYRVTEELKGGGKHE